MIALGFGKIVQALLLTATKIPPIWVTPIWLLSAAGSMALLVSVGNKWWRRPIQEKGSQSLVGPVVVNPAALVDKYYHRINPTFTAEVEAALRQSAAQVPASERETHLFHALTVSFIYTQFEILWFNIYASQIKALQRLNEGRLKREGIFPYYTEAATANAATYADYSFDQWLGFMRSHSVIREDWDLISITVRGQDFLKFLIDEAKVVGNKTL